MPNFDLSPDELAVVRKVLRDELVQLLPGGGEWSLTEAEEEIFWNLVRRDAQERNPNAPRHPTPH